MSQNDPTLTYHFDGGFTGRSNGSAAGNEVMRSMIKYQASYHDNRRLCIDWLRGFRRLRIVHADDGWVRRDESTFHPCYPDLQMRDIKEGDLIALGWATSEEEIIGKFRLVIITKIRRWTLYLDPAKPSYDYHFRQVGPPFEIRRSDVESPQSGAR